MNRLYTFICAILTGLTLHPAQCQYSEVGWANYYSDYFQGRQTAYGELYDRVQFTCAHRTLGQGTLIRVTRMDNGRSVVVRVNDKGPFTEGFVVSLSLAGALAIGLDEVGKARVQVDIVGYSATNQPYTGVQSQAPAEYNTYTARSANTQPREYSTEVRTSTAYNPAMPTSKELLPKAVSSSPSYVVPKEYSAVPSRQAEAPQSYEMTYKSPQSYGPVPQSTLRATSPTSNPSPQPVDYYSYTDSRNTWTAKGVSPQSYSAAAAPSASPIRYVQKGSGLYGIQIGSYGSRENAERQAQALLNQGVPYLYIMQAVSGNTTIYRLISGGFAELSEAEAHLQQIRSQYLVNGFMMRM
ncbi:MAG: septal ring lytic transglycosylase RlpA family protein [Haliscomenobacter sp.]|nr:septal ring lytic transglycosylase RlpA family protein [Haliscomenobacter sp.]